jgi:hypothetical protein
MPTTRLTCPGRLTTWLLLPLLAGLGCGSLPKFTVQIDSDPRGARIEVNNDYVGETPTAYKISGNGDRSFNGNWVQGSMIEFVATPPPGRTNLFVVRKTFRPSAFFQQGDHIPEKMFFDLTRKPEGLLIEAPAAQRP